MFSRNPFSAQGAFRSALNGQTSQCGKTMAILPPGQIANKRAPPRHLVRVMALWFCKASDFQAYDSITLHACNLVVFQVCRLAEFQVCRAMVTGLHGEALSYKLTQWNETKNGWPQAKDQPLVDGPWPAGRRSRSRFEHDNVSAVRCRGGDSLACSSSLPVIPRQWSRDSFPWRRWRIAGLGAVRWGHKQ